MQGMSMGVGDTADLTKQPRDRWQRLSLIVMAAGGISLIAAIVLLVLTLTGIMNTGAASVGPSTPIKSLAYLLTPQPTPTQPLPPASEAPIANLVIPRFDVDAPVVVRGVDANHVMETPSGPKDVAWYDFSGKPGFGSNAVFSGHVDYIDYGPAVFWHLKDLNEGDLIEVHLNDGTVYKYQVASRQEVPADPPADVLTAIIGPTQQDVVTLITCGGTFDYSTHQYDHRVVVRAERVLDSAPGQAAAAAPSP
jgi:LPXTG-site transpeptidase (sortase) family protein